MPKSRPGLPKKTKTSEETSGKTAKELFGTTKEQEDLLSYNRERNTQDSEQSGPKSRR